MCMRVSKIYMCIQGHESDSGLHLLARLDVLVLRLQKVVQNAQSPELQGRGAVRLQHTHTHTPFSYYSPQIPKILLTSLVV